MRLFDQNLYILCHSFLICERQVKLVPYSQALLGMTARTRLKAWDVPGSEFADCLKQLGDKLSSLASKTKGKSKEA